MRSIADVVGASGLSGYAIVALILDELAGRWSRWTAAMGDPVASGLLPDYLDHCATVGAAVRVELPDGAVRGTAIAVDGDGSLVVREDATGSLRAFAAADVVHLRGADAR